MRNLRRWEPALAVFVTVLMTFTVIASSTTQSSATTTQKTTSATPYDGETVFRGVLLNDGAVAKLFPEFWESPQVATSLELAAKRGSQADAAIAKQKIVDILRTQDPTFFSRFGVEMQSGDPVRVQQALTEAGSRIRKDVQSKLAPSVAPPLPPYTYIETYYYYYYYYYAAAAAAVVVLAVAALSVAVGDQEASGPSSNLQKDVYVNLIAQRLGTASSK